MAANLQDTRAKLVALIDQLEDSLVQSHGMLQRIDEAMVSSPFDPRLSADHDYVGREHAVPCREPGCRRSTWADSALCDLHTAVVRHPSAQARRKGGDATPPLPSRPDPSVSERRGAARPTCPHIVTSDEGTSYCDLAESTGARLAEAEALLREIRDNGDRYIDWVDYEKIDAFLAGGAPDA